MGIYKRKNSPVWWMSFSVDGVQYRRSTRTEDRQLAQKIFDAVKGKIALGKWIPDAEEDEREYTFNELGEEYLAWSKGRQRSYNASKKYIVRLLMKRFEGYYLDEFSNKLIEQLQSEYLNNDYSINYINKVTSVLKHMLQKAYEWEMIDEHLIRKIKKAKPLKGENKRLRYLSLAECEALIDACEPHLKPIVVTALNTGMRKSEILNLKWDQIDLRHGFILLDVTKNGERREIPINKTLRATLKGLTRRLDVPYVFFNPLTGKPYHKDLRRSFKTALKKATIEKCEECDFQQAKTKDSTLQIQKCPLCGGKITTQKGIEDFKFHDLRHTFASHLVMAGVDIKTVQELLGHKTLTMTLRYAHLAPAHKVDAVKKYDMYLNKKTPVREVRTG
jgi:integrase